MQSAFNRFKTFMHMLTALICTAAPRFKEVYLITISMDEERPYTEFRLRDVTTHGVVSSLENMGVFCVVRMEDLPEWPQDLHPEILPAVTLNNLELREGGKYHPIFLRDGLEASVGQ